MSIWFTEELHPYYRKGVRVKRVLADEQTQYQHLQFIETEFFGNAMILDGIIQLTERDNMGYHEMIVHVPMLAFGQPRRVLIVGGGDGGALQQVLRYESVEEVTVCELDQRRSEEHTSELQSQSNLVCRLLLEKKNKKTKKKYNNQKQINNKKKEHMYINEINHSPVV